MSFTYLFFLKSQLRLFLLIDNWVHCLFTCEVGRDALLLLNRVRKVLVDLVLGRLILCTLPLILKSFGVTEGTVFALAKFLAWFIVHSLVRMRSCELIRQNFGEVAETGFTRFSKTRLWLQNSSCIRTIICAARRAPLHVLRCRHHILRENLGGRIIGLITCCHGGTLDTSRIEILEIPLVLNSVELGININTNCWFRRFVTVYFWIGAGLVLLSLEDSTLRFLMARAFSSLRTSWHLHN